MIKKSVFLRNKNSNPQSSCNQVEEVLVGKDKIVKKFDEGKHDYEELIVAEILDFKSLVDEIYGLGVFDKIVGGDIASVVALIEKMKEASGDEPADPGFETRIQSPSPDEPKSFRDALTRRES